MKLRQYRQQENQRRRGHAGPNGRVPAEPLTAPELTVLRLLRGTLTRREIAQELCVSANTIKSHVRAVYQKLGVPSRRDAIQRGRELGIL